MEKMVLANSAPTWPLSVAVFYYREGGTPVQQAGFRWVERVACGMVIPNA
jgi:hypothetical protein